MPPLDLEYGINTAKNRRIFGSKIHIKFTTFVEKY